MQKSVHYDLMSINTKSFDKIANHLNVQITVLYVDKPRNSSRNYNQHIFNKLTDDRGKKCTLGTGWGHCWSHEKLHEKHPYFGNPKTSSALFDKLKEKYLIPYEFQGKWLYHR